MTTIFSRSYHPLITSFEYARIHAKKLEPISFHILTRVENYQKPTPGNYSGCQITRRHHFHLLEAQDLREHERWCRVANVTRVSTFDEQKYEQVAQVCQNFTYLRQVVKCVHGHNTQSEHEHVWETR